MWHSDHTYNKEELAVLRELEYDLFMANPGFRSMWNNNFEEYFNALFNEQKWKAREQERHHDHENNWPNTMSRQMIEDPEFARFMRDQAIMDEVLFGELDITHAPIEMQAELRQAMREQEQIQEAIEEDFENWMEQEDEKERKENPPRRSEGLESTFVGAERTALRAKPRNSII